MSHIDEFRLPVITVDDREVASGIPGELSRRGLFEIVKERLEYGDYVIDDLGVERKTVRDLQESLEDGRFFRQLIFLKRIYVKRLLIIEGVALESLQGQVPRYQGLFMRCIGALQIPIWFTKNPSDTALCLERLALQLFGFTTSSSSSRRLRSESDKRFFQVYVLAGIPGVGLARARALLDHFTDLRKVFAATESQLTAVPGIGSHLAAKINGLMSANWSHSQETG